MLTRKTTYLLIIFIVAGQPAFCQFSYGVTGTLTTNYRILRSTGAESWLKDQRNSSEIRRIGFSAGIIVNRRFSDVISIHSGIIYNDLGFKTRPKELSFSDNTTTRSFVTYKYMYITIPLDLRYAFYRQKNWNLFAGAGVSPAIFIQKAETIRYGANKSTNTNSIGYDRLNFIVDIQTGIELKMTTHFNLTGGLTYRQFLNATNANLPTRELLNCGGLFASILYK